MLVITVLSGIITSDHDYEVRLIITNSEAGLTRFGKHSYIIIVCFKFCHVLVFGIDMLIAFGCYLNVFCH